MRFALVALLWGSSAWGQEYTIRTLATDATGAGVAVDAPPGSPAGNLAVVVRVGAAESPAGVTIAVR